MRSMVQDRRPLFLGGLASAALALGLAACTPIPGTGGEQTGGATGEAEKPPTLEEQVSGAWGALADEPDLPRLEFREGGTLTGTDGCNGISGTYAVEAEAIVVEQAPTTMRACEGVDDWLRNGTEVRVGDGMLHVLNDVGTEIGQLERSK